MSQISFTIPLTRSALSATISALTAMNNDLEVAPTVGVQTQLVVEPVVVEEVNEQEEVDSEGQAWNPEIHASTKTKVADGTWKKKRGVTPPPPSVSETTPPPPIAEEGKSSTEESIVLPKVETTPSVSPFRQLLSDIAKAGLAPDYVQKTCLEVNGRSMPECKDSPEAMEMLRMALGL